MEKAKRKRKRVNSSFCLFLPSTIDNHTEIQTESQLEKSTKQTDQKLKVESVCVCVGVFNVCVCIHVYVYVGVRWLSG